MIGHNRFCTATALRPDINSVLIETSDICPEEGSVRFSVECKYHNDDWGPEYIFEYRIDVWRASPEIEDDNDPLPDEISDWIWVGRWYAWKYSNAPFFGSDSGSFWLTTADIEIDYDDALFCVQIYSSLRKNGQSNEAQAHDYGFHTLNYNGLYSRSNSEDTNIKAWFEGSHNAQGDIVINFHTTTEIESTTYFYMKCLDPDGTGTPGNAVRSQFSWGYSFPADLKRTLIEASASYRSANQPYPLAENKRRVDFQSLSWSDNSPNYEFFQYEESRDILSPDSFLTSKVATGIIEFIESSDTTKNNPGEGAPHPSATCELIRNSQRVRWYDVTIEVYMEYEIGDILGHTWTWGDSDFAEKKIICLVIPYKDGEVFSQANPIPPE